MFTHRYTEPELADPHFRKTMPPKTSSLITFSLRQVARLGTTVRPGRPARWVARVRVTTGCLYRERVMGLADDRPASRRRTASSHMSRQNSGPLEWFNSPEFRDIRVEERPIGVGTQLNVCPIGEDYTVAHAMRDYCQRKMQFGAKQSFGAAVSRANVYTLPSWEHTL